MILFEQIREILYMYVFPQGYPITDITVDLICTFASLFLIALPFIFIYRIIKLLGGR